MPKNASALFAPFTHKGLSLANRFVMAPMTRSFSPHNVPGEDVAAYYRRRAENGVALIITEGTAVDHPVALNDVRVPNFHGEDALKGWANVLAAVKKAGGKIMPQLWHVGLMRRAGTGPHPELMGVGPSGLFKPGKSVTHPMTDAEIADVIAAYARSAGHAKRLGFDGVEVHGAHGYIIDQFFWEGTNQRTDAWGGDMLKRTRFAVEIIKAIRREVGPDFPVILRWSQWKQQDYTARLVHNPKELEAFLSPLTAAGVDIYHCSTRRFWEPEFPDQGSDMNLAGWVKKISGKPTITVGSVGLSQEFIATFAGEKAAPANFDRLIEMFERGDFDLVAVGRALLVNPDWVEMVRTGHLEGAKPFAPEALGTLV